MSQSPITVTYSLEEVLDRLEGKIDRQFEEISRKIDRLDERLYEKVDKLDERLNEKIDRLDERLNEKIDRLDERLNEKIDRFDERLNKIEIVQTEIRGDINALDEKVNGLSKQLEMLYFISRGVLICLLVVIVGGLAKLFGFLGNP